MVKSSSHIHLLTGTATGTWSHATAAFLHKQGLPQAAVTSIYLQVLPCRYMVTGSSHIYIFTGTNTGTWPQAAVTSIH
jgi:hypothetical protein